MKCGNVDNIIIGAIVLTIIADTLGLFAEVLDQRCDKKAEREQAKKEEKLNLELENLRKRIIALEKRAGTV